MISAVGPDYSEKDHMLWPADVMLWHLETGLKGRIYRPKEDYKHGGWGGGGGAATVQGGGIKMHTKNKLSKGINSSLW